MFPTLDCRYCGAHNPFSYYGPITHKNAEGHFVGTCVCEQCAIEKRWVDQNGNIRPDVRIDTNR